MDQGHALGVAEKRYCYNLGLTFRAYVCFEFEPGPSLRNSLELQKVLLLRLGIRSELELGLRSDLGSGLESELG